MEGSLIKTIFTQRALHFIHLRLVLLPIFFVSILTIPPVLKVYSEDTESHDLPELPSDIGDLPSYQGGVPAVIDSRNAVEYRRIIIPEIYSLVKSGVFKIEAYKNLGYTWRLSEQFEKSSVNVSTKLVEESIGEIPNIGGYFFGNASTLNFESSPEILGRKILWNVHSTFFASKIIDLEFDKLWISGNKLSRSLRGHLIRQYPGIISDTPKSNQFFKELIYFTDPKPINWLSWLTYRFVGSEEDGLWVYSPSISKVRQLTGSNRSDPILKSWLSPDDLFVWSGKPELVSPVVERTLVGLVPYLSFSERSLETLGGDCFASSSKTHGDESVEGVGWNIKSKKFPESAGWVPTSAYHVPRKLWRLELTPKDPYSLYGRQILYVDQAMMLPVYKIVYDKGGQLLKIVMGSFSIARSKDGQSRYPVLEFVAAFNGSASEGYIFDVKRTYICNSATDKIALSRLSPSSMGPQEKKGSSTQ